MNLTRLQKEHAKKFLQSKIKHCPVCGSIEFDWDLDDEFNIPSFSRNFEGKLLVNQGVTSVTTIYVACNECKHIMFFHLPSILKEGKD